MKRNNQTGQPQSGASPQHCSNFSITGDGGARGSGSVITGQSGMGANKSGNSIAGAGSGLGSATSVVAG